MKPSRAPAVLFCALALASCEVKSNGSESEAASNGPTETQGASASGEETGASAFGDVGSPCNHGSVKPPEVMPLVTFPALSCDDLLCVYADDVTVPQNPCSSDVDCNVTGRDTFACNESGQCELSLDYVLDRSMCSRTCSTDADCANDGENNPVDPDSNCATGFKCTVLVGAGEFCCQPLCACNDDLPNLTDLEFECAQVDPATGESSICQ